MDSVVRDCIVRILEGNPALLRIAVRQRAKFEGWLKFELAHRLERIGMAQVSVESKPERRRDRIDITFFHDGEPYDVELKTANTNWRMEGVSPSSRPITMNIQAVIRDASKLNSSNGIVAFVLYPVPCGDARWEAYLARISEKTQIDLTRADNCEVVDMDLGDGNRCSLVVCAFRSRYFGPWATSRSLG